MSKGGLLSHELLFEEKAHTDFKNTFGDIKNGLVQMKASRPELTSIKSNTD